MSTKKLTGQLLASLTLLTMMFAFKAVPADEAGTANMSKRHVIEITGFSFQPQNLIVSVGDTIVWINKDVAPHTATANDTSWDTGEIKENVIGTLVVNKPEEREYFCSFHPVMRGRLIVR